VELAARIKQDATQFGAIVQKASIKPDWCRTLRLGSRRPINE
jgi:hypothetical protein